MLKGLNEEWDYSATVSPTSSRGEIVAHPSSRQCTMVRPKEPNTLVAYKPNARVCDSIAKATTSPDEGRNTFPQA